MDFAKYGHVGALKSAVLSMMALTLIHAVAQADDSASHIRLVTDPGPRSSCEIDKAKSKFAYSTQEQEHKPQLQIVFGNSHTFWVEEAAHGNGSPIGIQSSLSKNCKVKFTIEVDGNYRMGISPGNFPFLMQANSKTGAQWSVIMRIKQQEKPLGIASFTAADFSPKNWTIGPITQRLAPAKDTVQYVDHNYLNVNPLIQRPEDIPVRCHNEPTRFDVEVEVQADLVPSKTVKEVPADEGKNAEVGLWWFTVVTRAVSCSV